MLQQAHKILATKFARDFDLPPDLVIAICITECGGDHWATRFERRYRWLVQADGTPLEISEGQAFSSLAPPQLRVPGGISRNTEYTNQKTSWGLMQVMGAVAREQGFKGSLARLCDPIEGLQAGCRHLAWMRDRHLDKHGWPGVVDAYNDGSARIEAPDDYPHKVARNGAGWLFS